jgi:hypothetical protein
MLVGTVKQEEYQCKGWRCKGRYGKMQSKEEDA